MPIFSAMLLKPCSHPSRQSANLCRSSCGALLKAWRQAELASQPNVFERITHGDASAGNCNRCRLSGHPNLSVSGNALSDAEWLELLAAI